ncbi:alpha/beta fold hydrolase [Streptomyces sp. NPDC088794]|uniref:alpha/beta fold hydrolase n=1 Tax=Streptomyces sp. NPDC088794 TaxID=3365902 RepID=UPI003802515A
MPAFSAPDGTELAYHLTGEGPPLVCVPGGPMQASAYLGDLGGLSAHRRLVLLDLRGTGESATPDDPSSYRCDRQVDDVEALREHLGLDRLDLLGHSGGTNLALLYAARHPERLRSLMLISPSVYAVGVPVSGEVRRETALLRRDEPWFATGFEALGEIGAGRAAAGHWAAVSPFFYGRWDATAQAHHAAGEDQRNQEAAAAYGAEGAFDPEVTRAGLGRLDAPVLLLAGEVDLNSPPPVVRELAGLFPKAEVVVQAGASHFPWLDDPERFVATTAGFPYSA